MTPSTPPLPQCPGLIDIGANLTHAAFREDLAQVLARARAAGVQTIVVTGTSVEASAQAVRLAGAHPEMLRATAGVHPHHAGDCDASTIPALRALAAHACVVALGECGLDFNRNYSPHPEQERCFAAQLELACELGKPLFLHSRDAHPRFAELLRGYRDALPRSVAHCFTGGRDELRAYLDLGLYIGVTGWICDERRGLQLRELVRDIPLDRLLLETDAPYLTPRDLRPQPKARRNEPAFLAHILRAVAEARGETPEALGAATSRNARRFFDLEREATA
ncbi:MAG: TatD family hydrolase [Burkholderiales bacterium]|nr:TatD family hydrolase [Burkholderiales bacterium]